MYSTFTFGIQKLAHAIHGDVVPKATSQVHSSVVNDVLNQIWFVPARDTCKPMSID